jgi:hypothetical protein
MTEKCILCERIIDDIIKEHGQDAIEEELGREIIEVAKKYVYLVE